MAATPGVREIARLAGVSTATVSRVYRGVGQVAPATRDRVRRAIEEHGYRPSPFGTGLATQRHDTLGLVLPGLAGPYFAALLDGFDDATAEAGLSVHVLGAHRRTATAHELDSLASRVDGVAVHAGVYGPEALARLADSVPLVVLGGQDGDGDVVVRSDHTAVADLVRHLVTDHDVRRIAFLGRPEDAPDVAERHELTVRACADLGVPLVATIPAGLQQSDGVLAAPQVLGLLGDDGLDAVVCTNDETALGLLVALLGHGVRVPEDLAITGVDDVPMAGLVRPALTTLARPLPDLAAITAHHLIAMVAGREVPAVTVLPSTVRRRASCGCPEAPVTA